MAALRKQLINGDLRESCALISSAAYFCAVLGYSLVAARQPEETP